MSPRLDLAQHRVEAARQGTRRPSPRGPPILRRALALALCAQPVFWTSNVALAQSLQAAGELAMPPAGRSGGDLAAPSATRLEAPFAPSPAGTTGAEAEAVRGERAGSAGDWPPVDEPLDPDRYVCGPGDVLEVNSWGLQRFKMRVAIDLEGRAFVDRIGYLPLQGKSLSEARRILREALGRSFPRLNLDVALAEPRTFLVQVVDDVVRPASYPARAVDRVAAIITRAGGFGKNASKRRVEVRRRDGTVRQADLLLYALTGDVVHNPYLLDGDVVRVPFEELAASIDGAVNRPGRYELVGTRDLVELVTLAGGLAPSATRQLPLSLVRRSADDRQDQRLLAFEAGGALPASSIQHEDAVRVPSFAEHQSTVMVIGALASVAGPDEASATRRVSFVQGDTVRTLLDRLGGVGPLADLQGTYLLRTGVSVPVDLYSLLVLRDLAADRPVELGDSLVVPFKRRNVLVEGAVFRPGSYPFNPNYGIQQYLSLAGGPNRFALPIDDLRVVSPDGQMRPYAPDLKVAPGSSLVMPERNFSRAEVVQIILGAAGILLSSAALFVALRK
jgi:protein involved in polysaccharide export with SLBB domain